MNSNKLLLSLILILTACLLVNPALSKEKIISFDSVIDIKKDASMTVTETIEVRAEGNEIKRGIYRDFPTRYADRFGNQHTIPFDVQKVLRDGSPEPHFTETIENGVRLYIGEENRFIDPGVYEYQITYNTNRAIGYFENHDELYWNVTGHGWGFPIEQASATVNLPENVPASSLQVAGYTGYEGSENRHHEITKQSNGTVSLRTTRPLQPRQGFTVAVGWPKGIVVEPTTSEKIMFFLRDNMLILLGLALFVLVGLYYILAWIKVGVDPEKGVIIPRYEPPEGLSPAATRYVMEMGYDDETFTSALINLAVKGYVEIDENVGEYTVRKEKEPDQSLSGGEQELMKELFSLDDEIELEQDNHETIKDAMDALEDELEDGYHRKFFFTNTGYFLGGAFLSLLALAGLGYFGIGTYSKDTLIMLVWLSIWSIGLGGLAIKTFRKWNRFFRTLGSKHLFSALGMSLFTLPFLLGEILVLGLLLFSGGLQLFILILLFLGLNTLFYVLLKAPTVQGRKLMDKIQGLKRYIRVAEKDRLDLDELPEKTPELFERLLPYAIALGVGNEWANSFSDVLSASSEDDGGYQPGWYHGSFHSHHDLTSDLSGSLSSSVATSSTPPSSSSGAGGGGFSGGGVGGGGGGGW